MAHTPESRARAYAKTQARREKWIADNGPCRMCESDDRLEVDHIDPSLKVSHRIWSWSEAKMFQELAKCQVLCRKCHEEKTARENIKRNPPTHGSGLMYRKYGCRCEECLEYRRFTKRRDYARKKAKLSKS